MCDAGLLGGTHEIWLWQKIELPVSSPAAAECSGLLPRSPRVGVRFHATPPKKAKGHPLTSVECVSIALGLIVKLHESQDASSLSLLHSAP